MCVSLVRHPFISKPIDVEGLQDHRLAQCCNASDFSLAWPILLWLFLFSSFISPCFVCPTITSHSFHPHTLPCCYLSSGVFEAPWRQGIRGPHLRPEPRSRLLLLNLVVAVGDSFTGKGCKPHPNQPGQAAVQGQEGVFPSWPTRRPLTQGEFIFPLYGIVFNPPGCPTHPPHWYGSVGEPV